MKINVEVDCTPEEARRFMGLPDLSPIHDIYLNKMKDMVENPTNPEAFQQLMQNWAPMGDAGMSIWRNLFETGTKSGK
ncbi:MAG: hypothetical protein EOP62_05320 [Sphingomonadales bacterium]|nr:MAG: hypothetical protein EOP62_05320 [Sphingomonadales bacterium]